jgi:hypothetical protein
MMVSDEGAEASGCRWHNGVLSGMPLLCKEPDEWDDLQSLLFVLQFCASGSLPWASLDMNSEEFVSCKNQWVTKGARSLVAMVPALEPLAEAVAASVKADDDDERAGYPPPDYVALVATPLRPLVRSEHAVRALETLTSAAPSSVQPPAPATGASAAAETESSSSDKTPPRSADSSANSSPSGTPTKPPATTIAPVTTTATSSG